MLEDVRGVGGDALAAVDGHRVGVGEPVRADRLVIEVEDAAVRGDGEE